MSDESEVTGCWTTRRTEQRMAGGEVLPTYDVVDEAGAIVARVHAIGPGEFARAQRRAKLMAAAPALARLLWQLARAHGVARHEMASEAEAMLLAVVRDEEAER